MTNTLHRFSEHYAVDPAAEPAPIRDDYIVFAMATKDLNDDDLIEKYRAFLRLALKYDPVNIGDATKGGWLRPRRDMNPAAHWTRKNDPDAEAVIAGIAGHTTVAAVFDNFEAMKAFVDDLKSADVGIARHSVEYSLGFRGRLDRLPDAATLELSTMCGHGMIAADFAKKMIDWVKENRRTPDEAAGYMARFCSCGVFNTARARRILKRASGLKD